MPLTGKVEMSLQTIEAVLDAAELAEGAEPVTLWARPSDGDSDILFGAQGDYLVCIACTFVGRGWGTYYGDQLGNVLAHLRRHRDRRHRMPTGLEDTIRAWTWS